MAYNSALQSPLHVAVIPAGGARWAADRGLPPAAGHRAGIEPARRALDVAAGLGIGTLTLQVLASGEQRPAAEVRSILACLGEFLASETPACARSGVRLSVIGRRERLPADVLAGIERAEAATAGGRGLHLRLALDCASRDAIVAALAAVPRGRPPSRLDVTRALGSDVDLLVRTGGEQRLTDFLAWECARAELVFVETPWPEFGADELAAAVVELHRRRHRRSLPLVPVSGARP